MKILSGHEDWRWNVFLLILMVRDPWVGWWGDIHTYLVVGVANEKIVSDALYLAHKEGELPPEQI